MATHITEKVGSVGAAWPPRFDHHNNRIKGFCMRPVGSREELRDLIGIVREAEKRHPESTRTTVRAFVRYDVLREEHTDTARDYRIEAVVPAHHVVEGHGLAYFARNAPERMPDHETTCKELASVTGMSGLLPTERERAMQRIAASGYRLCSVNGYREKDVRQMFELYTEAYAKYTFDITPQTISDMLNNGNIVIVGRDLEGEIVSSLIAEHCALRLETGQFLHLFELSDYATFRRHRGHGLITAMQMAAVQRIREQYGGSAIVYAEDRAAWEAVNLSSKRAGLTFCGTLLQHCVLVSDRSFGETGIYENFNVWSAV